MNKSELIRAISEKTDMSLADSGRAVDAFWEVVGETLKKDESVTLVGIGTFSAKTRAARDGRNPQTGEVIKIAEKRTVGFKAGKLLNESI
ncbi:MAG: hypothetical protein GJ680_07865 [Alteromonadaceae bacterium]|nr:hypothetical protein [Alteromonadaceae bacterium]